ncbi:MAG TPA: hypothetical protein VME92_01260 [Acetobacteraceae bacterium]|nr:hypothetical protein [Acetobacteraceae bacterium]
MQQLVTMVAATAVLLIVQPAVTRAASATPSDAATTTAPAAAKKRHHLRAGEYATEAEAKQHCPSDTVVWASSRKVFHLPGTRHYGTTKHGGYGCEADLVKRGLHAAHGEQKSASAKPAKAKAGS